MKSDMSSARSSCHNHVWEPDHIESIGYSWILTETHSIIEMEQNEGIFQLSTDNIDE